MAASAEERSTGPAGAVRASRSRTRLGGEGQWASGDRTPLNDTERFKQEDDGLNVRARIEQVYAREGFASVPPDDLRGRFRWWGLYTQRRPGIPGGRTGSLAPEDLEDEFFMLRVRRDGGRFSTAQLRVVAELSRQYAGDTADLTNRQNVQLHGVRIEDVPDIWRRLEAVDLTTVEACGDTPRVVLGSPVAGVADDEIIDGTWAIEEIRRRFVGSPEFSNLPRKYKTAVSGSPAQDVAHESHDVAFVGVVHPEHGPGFDLWVGGGLSTNPVLARRPGAWVPLSEVPEVWAGIAGLFRDHGYRRLRHRARLKFLVSDWGTERFRAVLEQEYLHRPLLDGPPPPIPTRPGDHVGVHRQRDGRYYVGVAPVAGRVSGTVLAAVADLAEEHGSERVTTTAQQKLLVLDVREQNVERLITGLERIGLPTRPSTWRRSTMACTGIEFCKLALVETKARAATLVAELESRLARFDEPISIHLNGCPNSCARLQIADIGLQGNVQQDADGTQREVFQVHLGGGLGLDTGFAHRVRGHKVAADDLPDYVERLVRRFLAQRRPGERFAQWALRADDVSLR
ncbi:MAG: hypothetical protein QG608_3816 [Actinomycetota bacterium]|nr:hypothetical protein [Actinomycetota bacterium]